MSFHSKLFLEKDKHMTDPKLTDIMTVMVTSTLNTMDNGKVLSLRLIPLHLLPHKTHSTPTNFHLKPSPEKDKPMTDPKPTDTTMVTVMSTPNTMDNGPACENPSC